MSLIPIRKIAFSFFIYLALCPSLAIAQFVDANSGEESQANQDMELGILDLQAIQSTFNTSKPTDNIVTFSYDQNTTYKIRLRTGMTSTIILPEGEALEGHILGNGTFFSYTSKKTEEANSGGESSIKPNVAIIEPRNPGVDTNLTIFGSSGNVYSFYMRTDSYKSDFAPLLVTYVKDDELSKRAKLASVIKEDNVQESNKVDKTTNGEKELMADKEGDYLKELPPIDITKINRNYKVVSKKNELMPSEVFDDGQGFTYFKWGETLNEKGAPALYQVVDGFDVPVNLEPKNGYYIAKITHDSWTIRLGKKHLCIRKFES